MKQKIVLSVLLLLSIMAAGCMGDSYDSGVQEESGGFDTGIMFDESARDVYAEKSYAQNSYAEAQDDAGVERKVIRTADISLEADNVSTVIDSIENIAAEHEGYVSSSSVYDSYYGDGQARVGYITIRVPSSDLDDVLGKIGSLGKVTSESTSGTDVTEEYIDVEARLSNLEKQETRLQEILEMTTTVEEVLEVERELGRVRGEIESLTGRLNYLNDRIDLATIDVHVREPTSITHSWGLRDALSESVHGFISSVNGIIVFIGYALPVTIFLLISGTILVLIVRRIRG